MLTQAVRQPCYYCLPFFCRFIKVRKLDLSIRHNTAASLRRARLHVCSHGLWRNAGNDPEKPYLDSKMLFRSEEQQKRIFEILKKVGSLYAKLDATKRTFLIRETGKLREAVAWIENCLIKKVRF